MNRETCLNVFRICAASLLCVLTVLAILIFTAKILDVVGLVKPSKALEATGAMDAPVRPAIYWQPSEPPEYLWYFNGEKEFRYVPDKEQTADALVPVLKERGFLLSGKEFGVELRLETSP